MTLEQIKEELAKRSASPPDISEAEMSKTPLPPDNREELSAELDLARRRDKEEPRKVVRWSEWLEALATRFERRMEAIESKPGFHDNRYLIGLRDAHLDVVTDLRAEIERASNDQS